MSIRISVFGAQKDSDEYQAAMKLKQIIQRSLPGSAEGEIVLFASATLFGQEVKDVDILMIGQLRQCTIQAVFPSGGEEADRQEPVEIASFCTTIEVKRHDISGISLLGTDFYVKYDTRKHCVTEQSNRQKIAAMHFLKSAVGASPYVTNVIWFTQATPEEIRRLLTHAGCVMPSNVLGSDFDFKELLQLLIWQKPPRQRQGRYIFDSNYEASSLPAIQKALALFSTTKTHMGELTRRKIEQITGRALGRNALQEANGRISIYRGRAGTGKTVGLIQTAIHLVDEKQARVLMLTYNKALVLDIRRLLALAELPDMFEASCLHVNTMHSYFYRLMQKVLPGAPQEADFFAGYQARLAELLDFMQDAAGVELVKEACREESDLDWDYVLIDEAQDWSRTERDIILKLFDSGNIIVADGGQQFVRQINVCDWSVIRERNNIRLKYCLRQKENLVAFLNAYTSRFGVADSKVLTRDDMPGGKVIVTTDARLYDVHAQEMERLQAAGNIAYDMLYLVPHLLVEKQRDGGRQFAAKQQFLAHGIAFWDGTSARNRDQYMLSGDAARLLQYDSARGLEGWTVVCMDFDVFLEEKSREYEKQKDSQEDTLILESAADRKKRFLYNWSMIPLTRAIDTLVITVQNPESETAEVLKAVARECPDFVRWLL